MIRPSGGRLVVTVRQDRWYAAHFRRVGSERAATAAADLLIRWWINGGDVEPETSTHLRYPEGAKVWIWTVPYPKGHPLPPALRTLRGRASSMEEAVADGLARLRELYGPQDDM